MPMIHAMIGIGLGLFICFIPVQAINADDAWRQKSENWLQIADLVVLYVEKGKYVEARSQVMELSREFAKANLSTKELNIEAIHTLSDELVGLEHHLNRVVPNSAELRKRAMRLKLAFDAVSHPNQPLWKQHYQPMKQKIVKFYQAKDEQDSKGIAKAIQDLVQEYHLIRSAIVISKKPETVQKLDSLIRFMEKQQAINLQTVGVKRFEQVLDPLFFGSDQDVLSAYRPYVDSGVELIVIWICFWITAIFAYVGYKNYRAKKQVA